MLRVHRFAVATAVATWVLTIFGGLVSATDSGLACPDWPLCEGQWIPKMVDGKQFEHTHRLVASFVGVMMFGLCALIIKYRRQDRALVALSVGGVVLVTVQALLGALTVILKLPWYVSSAHFGTAMAFFAIAVTIACLTRQRLDPYAPRTAAELRLARPVRYVAALLYAQLVVGAVMRHLRAGLACGYEILTCLGKVWPADEHLGVHAHMFHRALGIVSGLAVLALAAWLWRQASATAAARRLAVALAVGVVAQVTLGVLTVLGSRPLVMMTVHSTLGIALFGGAVLLNWLVAPARASRQSEQASSSGTPAPAGWSAAVTS